MKEVIQKLLDPIFILTPCLPNHSRNFWMTPFTKKNFFSAALVKQNFNHPKNTIFHSSSNIYKANFVCGIPMELKNCQDECFIWTFFQYNSININNLIFSLSTYLLKQIVVKLKWLGRHVWIGKGFLNSNRSKHVTI